MILLNPGPVNVSPRVTAALARGDICHREPEMNELLAEMRTLTPDGFSFTKRESAFVLEIKEHFHREEETVFAPMRQTFTADQLAVLGERASAAKQHSPAFPDEHPVIRARS